MSRRTRVTVLLVILAAGVLAWVLYMRPRYVLPILMYHSVNPVALPADRLVITPGAFERQMRFLAERGYRVITVEEAAAFIAQKRSLPKRAVCVTFDDGFKDTYTYAFPILKRYGIRATLFVIVREVGRADRVSWDEVREMSASGSVCIGSHAFGPDPLFKMRSDGDLRHQLVDSKRVLEGNKRVLLYIKKKDLGKASSAMKNHILYTGKRIKSLIEHSNGRRQVR